MLLADLVATSLGTTATTKRSEKIAAIAELLGTGSPDDAALAVAYLAAQPRQGRIGIGWARLSRVTADAAPRSTLTLGELDALISRIAETTGARSQARRDELLDEFMAAATADEQSFVSRLLLGELRQGANEGVVIEAVARAAAVPGAVVRRALMLGGDLGAVTRTALDTGRSGLDAFRLEVQRPLRPMLASTAESVEDALSSMERASVEWKLDGARIQVHRSGADVRIWTRNLNDVTERLPGVAASVLALGLEAVVLDGETLATADGKDPDAFQDTMRRFGSDDGDIDGRLQGWFFDCLHLDGRDLIDEPLGARRAALVGVASDLVIPGVITDDPAQGAAVLADALAAGHEGVMVKDASQPYLAGRRGKSWRKVKPVHTLDLVVIAVEWGHGRRQGWLSNLHLGARGPDGEFVMVGKTFKGMTDALLTWQTDALLAREIGRDGITVHVRPELVVEIAIDGVQRSTRYPGGVALRFARVKGYRPDKEPADADTIETLRSLLG